MRQLGKRSALAGLILLFGALGRSADAQLPGWMFGPFEKPGQVNPIITPNGAATFFTPMSDSFVRWEGLATFNPAAVVKDGQVYVMYRAEDATGKREIGFHTSRLGLGG